MRVTRKFFHQPTLTVAKDLLGKFIVHKKGSREYIGMITETEAYLGPKDRASHSFGGRRTKRTEIEYGRGGHVYIYLVYGMYWQLNFTTREADIPECVLIRAVVPVEKGELRWEKYKQTNGPGKLCNYLHLDGSFYGEDLVKSKRTWLEDRGVKIKPAQIKKGPRIGIDYAGPVWAKKPWRFWITLKNEKKFFKTISSAIIGDKSNQ